MFTAKQLVKIPRRWIRPQPLKVVASKPSPRAANFPASDPLMALVAGALAALQLACISDGRNGSRARILHGLTGVQSWSAIPSGPADLDAALFTLSATFRPMQRDVMGLFDDLISPR